MEFLNVMLKVWMKYWNLFLQGLGMTLFMGLLTVLISTVFGSLMALMRRSNVGIGKFKPLRLIATVYVEIIRGTPILLQLYFFYFMLCNEFVAIVKETSLASTFFIGELMTQFKTINGLTFRVLEPLTIVGIIYFGVTFIMSKLIALLERRMNASER